MRSTDPLTATLSTGFRAIRASFDLPDHFPPEVLAEAEAVAKGGSLPPASGVRADRTDEPFVTLDPASSTDLDQAFHVTTEGDLVVLHYAIADVGAWVRPGGSVETEAWRRGVTVYGPDGRVSLYPEVLSSGAASLLPDGARPAVVLEVVVDPDGVASLRAAGRAMVRSRAKLAYESVEVDDLPDGVGELARRVAAAEEARGATRVDFPEQEVVPDPSAPGGLRLALRPRRPSEEVNSALSLSANLAVARFLLDHHVGLFRVMAEPTAGEVRALRRTAAALGVDWPSSLTLRQLNARLDPTDARHAAFSMAARRTGGGATYAPFDPDHAPFHAAIAAAYVHATAPLRRLADRYVLDALVALQAGDDVDPEVFVRLAEPMERAETVAGRIERASIDLVEATVLAGRVGEEFDAVVVEPGESSAIQLTDPLVRARAALGPVEPGATVRVRLAQADPARWTVRFERADGGGPPRSPTA